MTDVVPAGQSNELAVPDEDLIPGLEDFDTTSITIPRLRINGPAGTFVDGLTNEEFEEIEVIFLGHVPQRTLWPPEMSETPRGPLCKSLNGVAGDPDIKDFPWKSAKFNRSLYVTTAEDPESGERVDSLNAPLPCSDCKLKEWGTNPKGTGSPWCAQENVFPLLFRRDIEGETLWTPSILGLKGSGIKPSNDYCMAYRVKRQPMFIDYTTLKLKKLERGSVKYAVPIFTRGGGTPKDERDFYKKTFYDLKAYLQTPRVREDGEYDEDEGGAPTVSANRGPAAANPLDTPF